MVINILSRAWRAQRCVCAAALCEEGRHSTALRSSQLHQKSCGSVLGTAEVSNPASRSGSFTTKRILRGWRCPEMGSGVGQGVMNKC